MSIYRALRLRTCACLLAASLASCGLPSDPLGIIGDSGSSSGSGGGQNTNLTAVSPVSSVATMSAPAVPQDKQAATPDVSRFLSQATFGPTSTAEIAAVQTYGYSAWLDKQFALDAPSHLDYVQGQAPRTDDGKPTEEMSYEAVWQQWLYSEGQLRARIAWALSQIFVISNIAPDMDPRAMSSYMDMLNRDAFANYRTLLEDVTLHPAMGYYLNLLGSEKEDAAKGTHPNENYAREVMQLFSIGLVQLNPDGTSQLGPDGKPVPTYDQSVVQGVAKAFSGWSFGGRNTTDARTFDSGDPNWVVPMQPWPSKHSSGAKQLLNGQVLAAGQTPQQDMKGVLDAIFSHPNVGPFIARRLIQRLVTSNPSPGYIGRVAAAFNDNGAGVRGDLKAVIRTLLLDAEARDLTTAQAATFGKQREPVIRFANVLRALNAKAANGRNDIHYLDSSDNALGQSPLLAPSVFNFYSPDFRNPGPIAQAGLTSPEFQITTETSVVGTLNFFAGVMSDAGYGSNDSRLKLDFSALEAIASDPAKLVDQVDLIFTNASMSASSRASLLRAITAIPAAKKTDRVKTALVLMTLAPDFVIQH